MALTDPQYTALEDIVGPANVSADPVILYPYSWRSGLYAGGEKFMPLFEAVVLPATTAEVQAIVRLCNRLGLRFKASSTGWAPYNDASGPGVIKLDLRRMNRILEINEKSMYAVVEPYVISAQLQAECMKRGLNYAIQGGGAGCSALPIAAHSGYGPFSQSGSYSERNQLALEWVTPEGELVQLGSLGSTGTWFCGDGPGPSLRGIVRGNVTPMGGLGVYTKAATKLYHWPGPPAFPIEGVSPHYAPSEMPSGFLLRFLAFPSLDALDDAQRKIGESEIAYELMGFNAAMVAANLATSNDEAVRLHRELEAVVRGRPCLLVIVAGDSENDFEYKRRVLERIREEAGGESLDRLLADPQVAGAALWRWIRVTASIREVLRASGCFGGEIGGTDAYRVMANFIVETGKLKAELIEKGLIYDDGTTPFTQSIEHGHCGHGELLIRYRPDPATWEETWRELMGFMERANRVAVEGHFGVPGHVFGDMQHDFYGPHVMNYHRWLRRIKRSFDPNGASESSHHITAGAEP